MSGIEPVRRVDGTRAAAAEHVVDRPPHHGDEQDAGRKRRRRKAPEQARGEPGRIDVRA